MNKTTLEIADTLCCNLRAATRYDGPYRHFYADRLLPLPLVDALANLPIESFNPLQYSGKRDNPSATRFYVNIETMRRFPILRDLAEALQTTEVVRAIADLCAAPLAGSRLRLEYAVDREGFWLEPHTDVGEKKFTCLISLGETDQSSLGTDIYGADARPCKRAPFRRNGALMFVPGAETWHGFERRPIARPRRSIILNYVGPQWRASDQLAFPDQPVKLFA